MLALAFSLNHCYTTSQFKGCCASLSQKNSHISTYESGAGNQISNAIIYGQQPKEQFPHEVK